MSPVRKTQVNPEDAAEWLASLQLTGEGWWRQVALALKSGAHESLGLTRKEFTAQIGQRMIDPHDAILELYAEGKGESQSAIADILGVAPWTVARVLAEEGLIEMPPHVKKRLGTGDQVTDSEGGDGDQVIEGDATDVDEEMEGLHDEIEALEIKLKGEQKKRRDDVKEIRDKYKKLQSERIKELREAREKAEQELTQEDRERVIKEAEAFAEEEAAKIKAGLAYAGVQGVIGDLEAAQEQLQLLISQGGLTGEMIGRVRQALNQVAEELAVAEASAVG